MIKIVKIGGTYVHYAKETNIYGEIIMSVETESILKIILNSIFDKSMIKKIEIKPDKDFETNKKATFLLTLKDGYEGEIKGKVEDCGIDPKDNRLTAGLSEIEYFIFRGPKENHLEG